MFIFLHVVYRPDGALAGGVGGGTGGVGGGPGGASLVPGAGGPGGVGAFKPGKSEHC